MGLPIPGGARQPAAMFDAVTALTLSLGLAVQDPPAGARDQLYTPPPVRPFEPPSDFGRAAPEGDGVARPFRSSIPASVAVGAYAGQYEAEPTADEAQYAQGVAAAELAMDALAGPLDGRWSVVDADGRPLLRLVFDDPGPGLAIEGAWRSERSRTRGTATSGGRSPETVEIMLENGGALALTSAGGSWEGVLRQPDGRRIAIRLVR